MFVDGNFHSRERCTYRRYQNGFGATQDEVDAIEAAAPNGNDEAPEGIASGPLPNTFANLRDLRCVTYSNSNGEVLWNNHTEGVQINGQNAGGTSYQVTGEDFSSPRTFTVAVDGTPVGTVTCSR